jgi:hypothetical protein
MQVKKIFKKTRCAKKTESWLLLMLKRDQNKAQKARYVFKSFEVRLGRKIQNIYI